MKTFLPSMIEVDYSEYYKTCAQLLFSQGFKSFHIDFADGVFVNRRLEVWDKVTFLKSLGNDIKLTAHLMCQSGCHIGSLEEITHKCLKHNFETIYVHHNSFDNFEKLMKFKNENFVETSNVIGLVSELSNCLSQDFIKIINQSKVTKILQMGVPIGNGGQRFNKDSIKLSNEIRSNCSKVESLELDGGLTFNVLEDSIYSKINSFAGWSIIADKSPQIVVKNALKIKKIIDQ